jgi:hypothetical protein
MWAVFQPTRKELKEIPGYFSELRDNARHSGTFFLTTITSYRGAPDLMQMEICEVNTHTHITTLIFINKH